MAKHCVWEIPQSESCGLPGLALTRLLLRPGLEHWALASTAAWCLQLLGAGNWGKCHKNVRNHMGNPCNKLKCHETSSGLATHSPHKLVIGKIRVKWCYMCFKIWWRVVSLLFHQFIVDFKHPCSPCTLWGIHLPDIVLPWQKFSFQNITFIHKLQFSFKARHHFFQERVSLQNIKQSSKYAAFLSVEVWSVFLS